PHCAAPRHYYCAPAARVASPPQPYRPASQPDSRPPARLALPTPLAYSPTRRLLVPPPDASSQKLLAGVPGFEPGLSVLETDVLTVDTIPLRKRGMMNDE